MFVIIDWIKRSCMLSHLHAFFALAYLSGGEWDNWFIRNLGALTKEQTVLISSEETDNLASTFWMATAVNN